MPALPWRYTHRGGLYNTVIGVRLRRRWLLRQLSVHAGLPEAVTIVIGVRDRIDYKLENTLKSLRNQNAANLAVYIKLVDYDNDAELSTFIERLCAKYGAVHVKVKGQPQWNKPHCYNIGIKSTDTKYLMSCDADILFAPDYLSTAISVLRERPLSAIYSQMLDTPAESAPALQDWALTGDSETVLRIKRLSTPRSSGDCNEGINLTYTLFYHILRGYDEQYEVWGTEDTDLQRRFYKLGLEIVSIKDRTFYLHQWHPKYASLDISEVESAIARNTLRLQNETSIYRNPAGWGVPAGLVTSRDWSA